MSEQVAIGLLMTLGVILILRECLADLVMCTKLARWIAGGTWYYYKLGRDTPNIRMFTAWIRDTPDKLTDVTLLEKEVYPVRRWTKEY